MIAFIQGKVDVILADSIIVDVQGIGYRVFVSDNILYSCKEGQHIKLSTYLSVKEDGINLYGFSDAHENEIFTNLISISGIGPKIALSILSQMDVNSIATAIVTGNSSLLTNVKGIGKKTAERIILELRDKVAKMNYEIQDERVHVSSIAADCISTLISLGFTRNEAEKAVSMALNQGSKTAEEIISTALKHLNKI